MYTRLFTLILTLLFIFNNLHAQEKNKNNSIIISHLNNQEKAWNSGDIELFMQYYWKNDSLKFISKNGITYGWQNTLNNYKKSYKTKEEMGNLSFSIHEIKQLSRKYIYVIGKWELTKTNPSSGFFTLIWKKINNQWVIVADHTS